MQSSVLLSDITPLLSFGIGWLLLQVQSEMNQILPLLGTGASNLRHLYW